MWRRTAELENKSIISGPPPEQDIPLAVSNKFLKLFLFFLLISYLKLL
jgi:hypothetical protein